MQGKALSVVVQPEEELHEFPVHVKDAVPLGSSSHKNPAQVLGFRV